MKVERLAKLLPFAPTSSKQVMAYCLSKGYPIPKHRKTKNPTVANEALEKILRKYPTDPVLPLVLACRDLQKADAYLSDAYVGKDGRFHPEISQDTETLRFNSKRPNIMNQMKPEKFKGTSDPRKQAKMVIAEEIIGSIEASPGMILIERDYKAQESLLLGFFADDPNYMRMARLGIYSFFLSKKFNKEVDLSQPDAVVKKALSAIKAEYPFEYPIMKKTILARGYGEGVPAIAKDLEPYFVDAAKQAALEEARKKAYWTKTLEENPFLDPRVVGMVFDFAFSLAKQAAQEYVEVYEKAAPKVVAFQHSIRERAHKERKLVNPFGYPRYFYDVFTKRNGKYVLGSEANKALAFLPQSTGAAILKECMIALDERNDPDLFMLIPEHDKAVCECPIEKADHYLQIMKDVMEAPIKELNGLVIETEGKKGLNWGEMQDAL